MAFVNRWNKFSQALILWGTEGFILGKVTEDNKCLQQKGKENEEVGHLCTAF